MRYLFFGWVSICSKDSTGSVLIGNTAQLLIFLCSLCCFWMSPICHHLSLIWLHNDPQIWMINNLDSPHLIVDPFRALGTSCDLHLWVGAVFFPPLMASVIYKLMMLRSCYWCGMNGEVSSDEIAVCITRSPCKKLTFNNLFKLEYRVSTWTSSNNFHYNPLFMLCSFMTFFYCLDFAASLHTNMHVATYSICRIV